MTRRVAIAGVLAVCFTAVLVGVIAYVLVAHSARSSENRVLRAAAERPALALGPRTTYTQLAQLSTLDGQVLRRTVALESLGTLPQLGHGFDDVVLKNRHLRVYTVTVRRRLRLSVAVSDAPARNTLARLRRSVLIATIAAALIVSVLLIWLTRRALAPVRRAAAVADDIVSTGDLTARVPDAEGQDEIAQLSRSINRMLDHLEASDSALRRLVADASHELRSPVTTLRGNLELLTEARLGPEDRAEALADTRAEADRLGRLVEELLTLARADTVNLSESIALLDLIEEAIDGTGARLLMRPPRDEKAIIVTGDRIALRALVRNLVENADAYGGGAEVSLDADSREATITVSDHGPGIPDAERAEIFGRFRRGSAGAGRPGSGLGLAIVAATVRSHGGGVVISETRGGGATFIVRLPRR